MPYLGSLKLFEMPVLGYLGFPPFALECYAMYHWLRGAARAARAARARCYNSPARRSPHSGGGLS